MQNAYIVTGTLTNERTVTLDEALPLSSTKVRVIVELLESPSPPSYQEIMANIRQRQLARGHQPPLAQEVDAYLQAERESWE
jgi:protein-arginine kinase